MKRRSLTFLLALVTLMIIIGFACSGKSTAIPAESPAKWEVHLASHTAYRLLNEAKRPDEWLRAYQTVFQEWKTQHPEKQIVSFQVLYYPSTANWYHVYGILIYWEEDRAQITD